MADAPKTIEQLRDEKRAAASASVDVLFKDMKFKTPADRERMAKELTEKLLKIYEDGNGVAEIQEAKVQEELNKVISKKLGDAPNGAARTIRTDILKGTAGASKLIFESKAGINKKINDLLDEAAPDIEGFASLKASRRAQVTADLQALIPAELNKADVTTESLQAAIKVSLEKAAGGKVPESVDKTSLAIAEDVIKANNEAQKALGPVLEKLDVIDGAKTRKLNDDEKKAILASINERVWPELLRQPIAAVDRTALIESAFQDAIRSNAEIAPKDNITVNSNIKKTAEALNGYSSKATVEDMRKFVTDKVGSAAGGSMFGNFNVGTGTAIGGGIGATAGLLLHDKLGWFGSAAAALVSTGVGVAYDNGAFDTLIAGKTPSGPKTDEKGTSKA